MSVCVLGSINMDVVTSVEHLPRAGQTLVCQRLDYFPGGKGANQAIAAARLGCKTVLIGAVGSDQHGATLLDYLAGNGVDVGHIQQSPNAATGQAFICVSSSGENTIVVAPGANAAVAVGRVRGDDWQEQAVFLTQFEVPLAEIQAFLSCPGARRGLKIINAAPAIAGGRELFGLADVVIVNETELATYADAGGTAVDTEELAMHARALLCRPEQTIIVTLGAHGAFAVSLERSIKVDGYEVASVKDTTGAGDCFCGALSAQLCSSNASIESAMGFANLAAAISVTRLGATTAMPTRDEVTELSRRRSLNASTAES